MIVWLMLADRKRTTPNLSTEADRWDTGNYRRCRYGWVSARMPFSSVTQTSV